MKVLSWNIKSFVSCIQNARNALDVVTRVIYSADLIAVYEVPNSVNGNAEVGNLVVILNNLNPGTKNYTSFLQPSGGQGNENDQVAVIWDQNIATVNNTTAARRGNGYGGRAPAYFDVTEIANGNMREFCAWHAPEPTNAPQLIAQGWQTILHTAEDHNRNPLTAVIMGDFNNGNLSIPRRGAGRFLQRLIALGSGTTLRPNLQGTNYPTTAAYRTNNLYDQFFIDPNNVQVNMPPGGGGFGIYDVLNRLVTNAAPLTGLFGNQYNTAKKAYTFYLPNVSDHLPVGMDVTLL